ncbi:hypothetical protein CKY47_27795 [Saccharothrix yanglingensis]|uniref:Uncharacterized protein n=1 Tax=Saccharothrix yanglingensis TaxID=659496 RepID=A0ABU0X6H3_9PSEU|nr:hypothetical protein [Saccharothrix yanglingensis]
MLVTSSSTSPVVEGQTTASNRVGLASGCATAGAVAGAARRVGGLVDVLRLPRTAYSSFARRRARTVRLWSSSQLDVRAILFV